MAGMPENEPPEVRFRGVFGNSPAFFGKIFSSGNFGSNFGRAFDGVFSVFSPDGAKSQKKI